MDLSIIIAYLQICIIGYVKTSEGCVYMIPYNRLPYSTTDIRIKYPPEILLSPQLCISALSPLSNKRS